MKVKLDENVPAECVEVVRAMGHEATTVADQSMAGWSDEKVWPAVQKENRLFVTQDRGFGDLRRYPPGSHHGILLLRTRRTRPADIVKFFKYVLSMMPLDDLSGCLAVADPHGIRIRRPPAQSTD